MVAAELSVGPYQIEAAHFRGRVVHTNNANSGAFRGYGAPQAAFGLETAIGDAAARLGMDPVEMRRRNVLRVGDRHSLYGHRVDRSLRAFEVLEAVSAHEWWRQRDDWARSGSGTWVRGTGVALAMKGVGMGSARGDVARARLEISDDNKLDLFVGPNHSGQWIQTTYRQIASDTLGLPTESLRVTIGDTDVVPESGGCAASRSTYAGGSAVGAVCKYLLRQAEAIGLLQPVDWALALPLLRQAGISSFAAEFELPDVEADEDISDEMVRRFAPHATYGSSAQVARVEVNRLTGEWRVASVACAVDCGRAINPDSVVGQAEGGILQGLGLAQMEEYVLVEGLPATTNLESYLIPTAVDAPEIAVLLVESGQVGTAFGAKGMAEVVCVPTAPAVVSAIHEATGVLPEQLPVTAERLYRLLVESGMEQLPDDASNDVTKEI
jgi:CO/xanthine dehydrogenase Mo-binding subunit